MYLVYPKNNFQNHCFQFLLGITVIPKENEIKDILGREGGGESTCIFVYMYVYLISLACCWGEVLHVLNSKHDTVNSDG